MDRSGFRARCKHGRLRLGKGAGKARPRTTPSGASQSGKCCVVVRRPFVGPRSAAPSPKSAPFETLQFRSKGKRKNTAVVGACLAARLARPIAGRACRNRAWTQPPLKRGKGSPPRPRRVRRSCLLACGEPLGVHRAGRVLPQASLLRGTLRRSTYIRTDHTPTAGTHRAPTLRREAMPHIRDI
ncbi:hypothetical protein NDU88_001462 [Pleurodeles waltl]|uniref:Uncharacterized protein n=1 Tax=Pleurodeles waltl TaxID=8319 RepID=A0AAV7Q3R8_PLEWA|nr:hypothetical protein NDU88_001462 [Pleurodeles waltl]